ncbi:MAG: hypothetical protein E4H09_01810 [Spirochaetales bacterium]|nr:MAG: hypothetical protein E4H09_01810 [Spirochaetales bacterium]
MENTRRFWLLVVIVMAVVSAGAQEAPETLSEQMLMDSEGLGEAFLRFDLELDHYDAQGYPESATGLLVLGEDREGPMVYAEGDPVPYLLYAQYVNQQRDGVFLARTGTIKDPLPSGEFTEIPFGYGAVKLNTVYVSIIESLLIPHFSDNQKEYIQFPLRDLYVGGGIGLTGVLGIVRYVHTEQWVGYGKVGYNPFGSLNPDSFLNRYIVPVHLGGGYRFPGAFPEFLGENVWTAGADLFMGFGDRDRDPATDAGIFVPGVFLDIERVRHDEAGRRRDYRTDPRPYNYRVNSLVFTAAAYLNLSALTTGASVIQPVFGLSYQYNVIGPQIPEHEFKQTEVLYVHDLYREDLQRQAERRDARAAQ